MGKEPSEVNILALDTEVTTHNIGNAFDSRNKLVCVSWCSANGSGASRISPAFLTALQKLVDAADLIVGFNFKFDMHWFANAGIKLDHKPIWDCQNAEFVITRQTMRYPSLDACCEKYGLGKKIDVIKEEYWNKGINTDAIPWPVLKEYAILDAVLTFKLYHSQLPLLTPAQLQLLKLLNADLHVLTEMERNGMSLNVDLCESRSTELTSRIKAISNELDSVYPDIPINWNSGDQLSAFLYGGTITQVVKEHIGFYKSGAKVGQPRYQNREVSHTLPRLYEPLKGTELAKEGYWATNEDTLLKLKGKQGPIKLLLELSKLEKLNGTYYKGIPELITDMHWEDGLIHGSFNQVVAQTGRLSSTKPNLQNFASELQDIFISRYEN